MEELLISWALWARQSGKVKDMNHFINPSFKPLQQHINPNPFPTDNKSKTEELVLSTKATQLSVVRSWNVEFRSTRSQRQSSATSGPAIASKTTRATRDTSITGSYQVKHRTDRTPSPTQLALEASEPNWRDFGGPGVRSWSEMGSNASLSQKQQQQNKT